jgi:hypothetical protein
MQDEESTSQRLRDHAASDHKRGCNGRYFGCECGYDRSTEELLGVGANELDRRSDRIAALEARNEELEAALRCVSVPAGVKAMKEKIAALESRVEVLTTTLERIVDFLGYAQNEGKSSAVRECNSHNAWKAARSALSPVYPVTEEGK